MLQMGLVAFHDSSKTIFLLPVKKSLHEIKLIKKQAGMICSVLQFIAQLS